MTTLPADRMDQVLKRHDYIEAQLAAVVNADPIAVRVSPSKCWTKFESNKELMVCNPFKATAGQVSCQTVFTRFSGPGRGCSS